MAVLSHFFYVRFQNWYCPYEIGENVDENVEKSP